MHDDSPRSRPTDPSTPDAPPSGPDAPSDARRAEWNERYGEHSGQMWSGRPNGSLVATVADLTPGRALDVGCGEGADAIWLAGRGWTVRAVDVADVAVDRGRGAAVQSGVEVDFDAVDVLTSPPDAATYDLVALSYPALPVDPGREAVRQIIDAVAPGGRLLVIGHVIDHHHDHEGAFDPADYVSVDDIVEHLGDTFTIEIDEQRMRPDAPPDAHHVDDRVLLARRDR